MHRSLVFFYFQNLEFQGTRTVDYITVVLMSVVLLAGSVRPKTNFLPRVPPTDGRLRWRECGHPHGASPPRLRLPLRRRRTPRRRGRGHGAHTLSLSFRGNGFSDGGVQGTAAT